LINYLKGNLSGTELQSVEQQIAESEFVNDAVEGLKNFASDKKLNEYVKQLNNHLHQHLENKKQQKEKRKIKELSWIILAVCIILILCVLAFVVLGMERNRERKVQNPIQTTIIWERKFLTDV
jgi:uncharacterized membrane protein YvbJ